MTVKDKFVKIASKPEFGYLMIDLQKSIKSEQKKGRKRDRSSFKTIGESLLQAYYEHVVQPALEARKSMTDQEWAEFTKKPSRQRVDQPEDKRARETYQQTQKQLGESEDFREEESPF